MTGLLQVEGLGKRFGGFVALDGIQSHIDNALGCCTQNFWNAFEHFFHITNPHRQRRHATRFIFAKIFWLVMTKPRDPHQRR